MTLAMKYVEKKLIYDKTFRSEMKAECRSAFHKDHEEIVKNACIKIADAYYESVKQAGKKAWKDTQAKSDCL